jgi:hypothetical protein
MCRFYEQSLRSPGYAGWDYAERATSLVNGYAVADRMEESNSWRNPIDLVEITGGGLRQASGCNETRHRVNPSGTRVSWMLSTTVCSDAGGIG